MHSWINRSKLRVLILVSMIFSFVLIGTINEFSKNTFSYSIAEAAKSTVTFNTKNKVKYAEYNGKSYKVIKVKGGDLSGKRQKNVAVDIGYGNRLYWGFTNKYGQLVYVVADKITLQNPKTEKVLSNGRYYKDEANVPGTEKKDLDQGHVIADSLGGVSNAYNITPQNSILNRLGDQAYMEKVIRDAGGCTEFKATITYPNTTTQIPSHYKFTYKLKGEQITDEFDNVNPDKVNKPIIDAQKDLAKIDKNGDGKVTIAEAKAAGYSMPIYSDHWLYKYMDDRDSDGMVGE
ncbi:DNA/RNA non-specific endonuclease [Anaerocolumna sp. MB42-C2]|uniref:DNA/RNA non-specific endonuclease n=1 Tax=Anaerocolumna sp. MB42-C2 TaxID=3070997 RepID=UPI0027E1B0A3|nr:DNA/RNA non-specific endonuclease [Anaerocolumna sp. MB42-C2]WMJ87494.1 DNA/RNA non-specific endonuclease [Anaerocolumna sp. MB42-C2]